MFLRTEVSLALFAISVVAEEGITTEQAIDAVASMEDADPQLLDLALKGESPLFASLNDVLRKTLENTADYNSQRAADTDKFNQWSAEDRDQVGSIHAPWQEERVASGLHEVRSLTTTGDGYTAYCNPYIGACTCDTGDYWQLGWCQTCVVGCTECISERKCTTCGSGFVRNDFNECLCESGELDTATGECATACGGTDQYFSFEDQACKDCADGCATCTNLVTCSECTWPMMMGKWAEQGVYSVNSCRCFSKHVRDFPEAGGYAESAQCARYVSYYCEESTATGYSDLRTKYYRYGWGYLNAGHDYASGKWFYNPTQGCSPIAMIEDCDQGHPSGYCTACSAGSTLATNGTCEDTANVAVGYDWSGQTAAVGTHVAYRWDQMIPPFDPNQGSVDWRSWGVIRPVLDMGACGATHAITAVGLAEAAWSIMTGLANIKGSPQQVIDCDATNAAPCGGGSVTDSLHLLADIDVFSSTQWPWTGTKGTCHLYELNQTPWNHYPKFTVEQPGASSVQNGRVGLRVALRQAPVAITFNVLSDFRALTDDSTYMGTGCATSAGTWTHNLMAVGYDTDAAGNEYVIVQGPWGTSWGQSGYGHVYLDPEEPGTCGMFVEMVQATAGRGNQIDTVVTNWYSDLQVALTDSFFPNPENSGHNDFFSEDYPHTVSDYYSCATWAEVYETYIANEKDLTKFEFYSNFTVAEVSDWPCSYWLPTNVYANCKKVQYNFMNYNKTAAYDAQVRWSHQLDDSGTARNLTCDYWLEVTDYPSCLRVAVAQGYGTYIGSNARNDFGTDRVPIDCWSYQTTRDYDTCKARASTDNHFAVMGTNYNSANEYSIDCPYYKFRTEKGDFPALYTSCKTFAGVDKARLSLVWDILYFELSNGEKFDCWQYGLQTYAQCQSRSEDYNSRYADDTGPLGRRSTKPSGQFAKIVTYLDRTARSYIDCFSYSDQLYADCQTRSGTEKFFEYYHDSTKSYRDCWTYASAHDYASCSARATKSVAGFTEERLFTNKQEPTADVDCWTYKSGAQAEMYEACKTRSSFLTSGGATYQRLYFFNDVVGEVECFHYKEKTFDNCETRTAFTAYRAATSDLANYSFGLQHNFRDRTSASLVDCWDYVGYPTMAHCITRSTYVASQPAPYLAAGVVKYYFTNVRSSTAYECFDYSPDYEYCNKRLAVSSQTGAAGEKYWEHHETSAKIYCSAYKDGNNDV